MKERFMSLKKGLDEIHTFYDKIDKTSTQALNEIMPDLGKSFPDCETESSNTVKRSLGNKSFEGLTQIERIIRENDRYKVKVKLFTIDWDKLPFFDKPKVLRWINDIIDAWKPSKSELLKTKKILETGISEIEGYLATISDISDKLLNEILPNKGDCREIKGSPTDEDVILLYLEHFDHPEPIVEVCRTGKGDNFLVQTTTCNHNWTDLPPLEKSFLLNYIEKSDCKRKDEL